MKKYFKFHIWNKFFSLFSTIFLIFSLALEVLMRISRLSLSSVGAWPLYANKTLSRILFFISYLIVTFTVFIPQGIKLIQVRDNLDQISQILSTAELPFLIALTKMSVLYYNKESLYCFRQKKNLLPIVK